MQITATLYDRPGYTGGPAVNLCRLLPSLARRGHQVRCLVLHQGGDAPNGRALEAEGIACELQDLESLQWHSEKMVRWILERLAIHPPDVFIANNSVPAAYAGRWTKAAGIPSVSTHRSHDAVNWAIAETFGRTDTPWAASAMVCVSDFLREEMQRRWQTVPLRTIRSGVPLSPRLAEHGGGPLRMVYAGRLEVRQKAVDQLCVHLFPWLAGQPDIHLTLLGSGAEEAGIAKRIATEGLQHRVSLLPPLRGEAYHRELARHHLMLLYSHYEGTPGALMDGMSCGLIPLVRDIPGIRELVLDGVNGFRFPVMDDAVLQCVMNLKNNPAQRAEMGKEARNTIEREFSIGRTTDLWESLLREVVANTGPRRALRIPKRISLPPPHPDFGAEDLREPVSSRPSGFRIRRRS